MKQLPEVMGKAMHLHNNALRKVRWQHVGYTAEQEGDSFSFSFSTADDALKFCLQVILLLLLYYYWYRAGAWQ